MSEEDFKSIRITLSQEAFDRLKTIIQIAKFRSNSSAIEESIRVVYEIVQDITAVLGKKGMPFTPFSDSEAKKGFENIVARMGRITGRRIIYEKLTEKTKSGTVD